MGVPSTITAGWQRAALSFAALLTAVLGLVLSGPPVPADAAKPRPNVLIVMSDDQTAASMEQMPQIRSRIGDRGATFPDNFTNWPLCCPSRATYLTGQYVINHQVRGNAPGPVDDPDFPVGGYRKFRLLHGNNNLATWMQDAGYYTAHVGKYLNGYALSEAPTEVPDGWTKWYTAASQTQTVYDYELNENGTLVPYGHDVPDFKGDVITDKAVDFISQRAPSSQPFFLSVAYTAPHGGGPNPNPQPPDDCQGTAKPAPRHASSFDSEPLPTPPNFNEGDVSDKPAAISGLAPLDAADVTNLTRRFRCRIESILHVDEGVSQMLDELAEQGELKNTIVIYTSDNGFFTGEHRVDNGKNRAYEEAIRVPLLMRGPGIPQGVTVRDLAVNADLAPTIVDAANADAGLTMDGRSLIPLAQRPRLQRGRELLIEKGAVNDEGEPDDPAAFVGVRNRNFKYVEYGTGERELYDLRSDPFELENKISDAAYDAVEAALAARLNQLDSCAGAGCRTRPDLELRLAYDRGRGGCAERPVDAKVRGADVASLALVTFEVNGDEVGERTEAPFDKRIPYGEIRDRRRSRVTATAETIDGRVLTLEEMVRAC
jgi:arylsulfatase A-like enzyme